MNYILFDDSSWNNLLPLTFTRPVGEIRVGILKISEKWEKQLLAKVSYLTQDYLLDKYSPVVLQENILINGSILPTPELVQEVCLLKTGQLLQKDKVIIAVRLDASQINDFKCGKIGKFEGKTTSLSFIKIEYPWQIFSFNDIANSLPFSSPLSRSSS